MKQLVFSIFSVLLVTQIFLGTTGVIVHEHHCKKDGTSRSLFVEQDHERDNIEQKNSCAANSCCSAEKDESNIPVADKEACCSSSIDYVQLDTDLALEKNEVHLVALVSIFNSSNSEGLPTLLNESNSNYRGPPPSSTLDRLAVLQTYII